MKHPETTARADERGVRGPADPVRPFAFVVRWFRRAVRQGTLPAARYIVREGTNWHICTLEIDCTAAGARTDPEIRHAIAALAYKCLGYNVTHQHVTWQQ